MALTGVSFERYLGIMVISPQGFDQLLSQQKWFSPRAPCDCWCGIHFINRSGVRLWGCYHLAVNLGHMNVAAPWHLTALRACAYETPVLRGVMALVSGGIPSFLFPRMVGSGGNYKLGQLCHFWPFPQLLRTH